jgi:hypothetical protein
VKEHGLRPAARARPLIDRYLTDQAHEESIYGFSTVIGFGLYFASFE